MIVIKGVMTAGRRKRSLSSSSSSSRRSRCPAGFLFGRTRFCPIRRQPDLPRRLKSGRRRSHINHSFLSSEYCISFRSSFIIHRSSFIVRLPPSAFRISRETPPQPYTHPSTPPHPTRIEFLSGRKGRSVRAGSGSVSEMIL